MTPEMIHTDETNSVDIIKRLAYFSPEVGRQYEATLREIMRNKGRTPPDDVDSELTAAQEAKELQEQKNDNSIEDEDDQSWEISGLRYIDYDAIQAAFILIGLFPEDPEAVIELNTWREKHPSAITRQWVADDLAKFE